MKESPQLKRTLLYLLVGSVMLGALLGIIVVLRNTWGWFETRVILTTITVAVSSLCGLACDLSRTPRGGNYLPRGGLLLTFISALMIVVGMWADFYTEPYWKTVAVLSIFAVATVHVCLLSIARLARRFGWVLLITNQVIFGLASLLSVLIIWEIGDAQMYRFVATLSIVDAALTLVVPLLHRISKTGINQALVLTSLEERNVGAIDQELCELRERIASLEKLRAEIVGAASPI